MRYIGYVVLSLLALSQFDNSEALHAIFIVTCIYMIYQNRAFTNIVGLIVIILALRLIELPMLALVGTSNNYALFASYFLIDLPVIIFVVFRAPLSRYIEYKRLGSVDPDRYVITNADMIVGKIYIMYCLLNTLALVENGLRHLDDFGFDGNSSAAIWLYQNARLIWNNYEYIKVAMNITEFAAILATASNYMRSANILRA